VYFVIVRRTEMKSLAVLAVVLALCCAAAPICFAGTPMKWEEIPEAVRKAVIANGGTAASIDKEGGTKDGKAIYEAQVKDKDGNVKDLVILDDGKLVEVKTDDATDRAQEQIDRAKKILTGVKFSHPRDINNPYLPLAALKEDVLEGNEGSKKVRITRIAKPEVRKTFKIGEQSVEAFAVEDREWENGALAEVALDYFVQDDNGTVYYLGEEVDEYADGKVVGHEGSWMLGKDTQVPGILFPGKPKIGDKFKSEDVSPEINETDEVVSLTETVAAPAGTYKNCVEIKENLADGTTEYKYFAKGVGVVREVPPDGNVLLKSHETAKAAK
jgi:hypothetical protein